MKNELLHKGQCSPFCESFDPSFLPVSTISFEDFARRLRDSANSNMSTGVVLHITASNPAGFGSKALAGDLANRVWAASLTTNSVAPAVFSLMEGVGTLLSPEYAGRDVAWLVSDTYDYKSKRWAHLMPLSALVHHVAACAHQDVFGNKPFIAVHWRSEGSLYNQKRARTWRGNE